MAGKKWDTKNVGDQSGRVVIVTGASSGIGYETARVLASKKADVIMAVRDLQKGKSAEEKIKTEYAGAHTRVMEIDLASLKSVASYTAAFRKHFERLDLLINNAGVMIPPYSKTADGFELQFGTNHLGHFALTAGLFGLMKATPGSRIVTVSSTAHRYGNLDFEDLNWEKRKYIAWKAYGDSKIANLYFTYELSRRLNTRDNGPVITAAHPGWTATGLQRHSGILSALNFLAQSPAMGALPILYAAVAGDVKSGDYYGPSGFMETRGYPKKVISNALSRDEAIAGRLWEVSEALTGVGFDL